MHIFNSQRVSVWCCKSVATLTRTCESGGTGGSRCGWSDRWPVLTALCWYIRHLQTALCPDDARGIGGLKQKEEKKIHIIAHRPHTIHLHEIRTCIIRMQANRVVYNDVVVVFLDKIISIKTTAKLGLHTWDSCDGCYSPVQAYVSCIRNTAGQLDINFVNTWRWRYSERLWRIRQHMTVKSVF